MRQEELLGIIRKAEKEKAVKLDLSEHKISYLPPEIGNPTSLQVLIAAGLSELPAEIGKLKNLSRLYLNSNYLTELPDEISQLKNLTVLDLSSNQLTGLPKGFSQLKNLSILDLNTNHLSELPDEITQLKNLTILDASSNYLRKLPDDFARLVKLDRLDLSSNHIDIMPEAVTQLGISFLDLSFNQISELPSSISQLKELSVLSLNSNQLRELPRDIAQLGNLTQLYLNFNQMTELVGSIARLKNLSILSLNSNYLTQLPKEIAQLGNLTELYAGNNQLRELPRGISMLKNLSILDLSSNQLTELPREIAQLGNLTVLYLDSNQITRLPKEIVRLKNITHLDLNKNPLVFPPVEIASQGLAAITDYLKNSGKGGQTLYEGKLLVVGQGGVGKTCLIKRLSLDKYSENQATTKGIEIQGWKLPAPDNPATEMSLNVWDFGGQEIYHATHQFFLTQRSLYILVWDARQEEEFARIDYWLKTINTFAEDSPIVIVMNKSDERNKDLNLTELKNRCPQVIASRKVSAKKGKGIEELRKFISRQAWGLPLMGTFWPSSWLAVRRALKASSKPHVPYRNYLQVCARVSVEESEAKRLSRYLHDLGMILHFQDDPLLNETIILKPEWGTDAVYKVLDAEVVQKRNGILYSDDLPKIWNNHLLYPKDKYPTILRLMANFELAFPFGDGTRYIVAGFLSPREVEYENWKPQDPLRFEYHYEFMPAGMVTRLIVRMHEYLIEHNGEKLCWREGAYFEYEGSQSLVKINLFTKIAMIQIYGPTRRDFLAIIRSHFAAVHKSIRKIHFKEKIPCICHAGCEHRFDYEFLLKCEERSIRDVICEKNAEYINVGKLLDGIEKAEVRRGRIHRKIRINGDPEPSSGTRAEKAESSPGNPRRPLKKRRIIFILMILAVLSGFIFFGTGGISVIYEFLKRLSG